MVTKATRVFLAALIAAVAIVASFSTAHYAEALNTSGNKASNFQGYRYLNNQQVQIWVDKTVSIFDKAQFKIFEGANDTGGRELAIADVTPGSGSNTAGAAELGNASSFMLTTAAGDAFESGKTYTVVLSNTIKSKNGLTIGNYYFRKDVVFSFAAPDDNGAYAGSLTPVVTFRPENSAPNVPYEGNVWLSVSLPVSNYDAVKNGLVLKKNGVPLNLDTSIDSSQDGDIYAPLVTDDHTFFFFPMTASGANTSYNLAPDSTYSLEVPEIQTVNGDTIPAQTIDFRTATEDIPARISGPLTVSRAGGNFQITWNAPSERRDANNNIILPGATGYNVYASQNPYWDFVKINYGPVKATSYVTSGLNPSAAYYFRVTSLNSGGEAGFSDYALSTNLPDASAPVWPGGSTLSFADVTQTRLTLKWTAASDNAGVTGYKVYQDEKLLGSVDGGVTTYKVSGLTEDTEYNFKVEAGDAAGNWSEDGPCAMITTPAGGSTGDVNTDSKAPAWPDDSKITVTRNQNEAVLSWPAATDKEGITGYKIYRDGKIIGSVNGSITTYTDTGLERGSNTYTWEVKAGDAAGNWSTSISGSVISGNNPLVFQSACLTTVKQNSSTTGESIVDSKTVPACPTIKIEFDRNVVNDGIWGDNQRCFSMQDSSGLSVPVNVFRILPDLNFEERRNIFITPLDELIPGEQYKITIDKDLKANNGNSLGENTGNKGVVITFTVAASNDNGKRDGVVLSTSGRALVNPDAGGTIGLGSDAVVEIPAGALKESDETEVRVQRVISPPAMPADVRPASEVFEFLVGDEATYSFAKDVTVTLKIINSAISADETPAVYYYDQSQADWISIGGTVSGSAISVEVDYLSRFAVFYVKKATETPGTEKPAAILSDIAGHWAEGNIEKLVALKAVNGYPDGSFKPDSTITRAEFVTILVQAFKPALQNGGVFADTAGHWARDAVSAAASCGITSGLDENNFGPDELITREQMAVMVVQAAKLALVNVEPSFTDSADISEWAVSAVATATKSGIMKGYPDNTVRPKDNASRAEAVTVIINALK